jgi:hypothetical protein
MLSAMNSGEYCAVCSLKYVVCIVNCAMYSTVSKCNVWWAVAMFSGQCTEMENNIGKAKLLLVLLFLIIFRGKKGNYM